MTTAGGVEEDLIKCLAPTYVGDFKLDGATLRSQGLNRVGNLLVPNNNYCKFEDWLMPILDAVVEEQKNDGTLWTPSKLINRLGKYAIKASNPYPPQGVLSAASRPLRSYLDTILSFTYICSVSTFYGFFSNQRDRR